MPEDHRAAATDLLALHALRLGGVLDDTAIAARIAADRDVVAELLLDHEAFGWVSRVEFADLSGWALTERGRREDERRLAAELDAAGTRARVEEAHHRFEALNARVVEACTRWQMRPAPGGRSAPNAHDDPLWDGQILDELEAVSRSLDGIVDDLSAALPRFAGYDKRFTAALARARSGSNEWVAGIEVDSCHKAWMELHADLLSTLGLSRDPGS